MKKILDELEDTESKYAYSFCLSTNFYILPIMYIGRNRPPTYANYSFTKNKNSTVYAHSFI